MKKKKKFPTKSEGLAPKRTTVRLWLDHDVAEFFKSLDGYEDTVNRILREYVNGQKTAR